MSCDSSLGMQSQTVWFNKVLKGRDYIEWILCYCVNIYAHLLWTWTHESFCSDIFGDFCAQTTARRGFRFRLRRRPSHFICIFQIMMPSDRHTFPIMDFMFERVVRWVILFVVLRQTYRVQFFRSKVACPDGGSWWICRLDSLSPPRLVVVGPRCRELHWWRKLLSDSKFIRFFSDSIIIVMTFSLNRQRFCGVVVRLSMLMPSSHPDVFGRVRLICSDKWTKTTNKRTSDWLSTPTTMSLLFIFLPHEFWHFRRRVPLSMT